MSKYIIKDSKGVIELMELLDDMDKMFAGNLARHVKTGNVYRISHVSVLNQNEVSELAMNYHPYIEGDKHDITSVRHTRSCEEFLDGRFEF